MVSEEFVAIGEISAPQGLKGEFRVKPLTDYPERFRSLRQVFLARPNGVAESEPRAVQSTRNRPPFVLVKLAGVDDPETAAKLRGMLVRVPKSEVYPLPQGSYYVFQLLGLTVVTADGERVGVLDEVITGPANDVYAVKGTRTDGQEARFLIPAIKAVVAEIDLENQRMVITPLPGLLE